MVPAFNGLRGGGERALSARPPADLCLICEKASARVSFPASLFDQASTRVARLLLEGRVHWRPLPAECIERLLHSLSFCDFAALAHACARLFPADLLKSAVAARPEGLLLAGQEPYSLQQLTARVLDLAASSLSDEDALFLGKLLQNDPLQKAIHSCGTTIFCDRLRACALAVVFPCAPIARDCDQTRRKKLLIGLYALVVGASFCLYLSSGVLNADGQTVYRYLKTLLNADPIFLYIGASHLLFAFLRLCLVKTVACADPNLDLPEKGELVRFLVLEARTTSAWKRSRQRPAVQAVLRFIDQRVAEALRARLAEQV